MHHDLLDQAMTLAMVDSIGKPRQANLRRAVSATYYGLFHFLVDQSCRAIMGTQHSQQGLRHALSRAFEHGQMKEACKCFSTGTLPNSIAKPSPGLSISLAITKVSRTFVNLQEKRHQADYDLAERFRRSDVLTLIRDVESDIALFEATPTGNDRQLFLVSLLAWKQIARR